jgi:hypothetical protein
VALDPAKPTKTTIAGADVELINSTLSVSLGQVFTVAEGAKLTLGEGSTLNLLSSLATLPTTAPTVPPVTISGEVVVQEGATVLGLDPTLFTTPPTTALEDVSKYLAVTATGTMQFNWGSQYSLGPLPLIGFSKTSPYTTGADWAYQWSDDNVSDGAQIEFNAGGINIRDTNGGAAYVSIGAAGASILKAQTLTVEENVTLDIWKYVGLGLFTAPDPTGGAQLVVKGKVTTADTEITGNWQAVGTDGDVIIISRKWGKGVGDPDTSDILALKADGTASSGASFKALPLTRGTSTIAQSSAVAGSDNKLYIGANTTISLGDAAGRILLKADTNSGLLDFVAATSKVTMGGTGTGGTASGTLTADTAIGGKKITYTGLVKEDFLITVQAPSTVGYLVGIGGTNAGTLKPAGTTPADDVIITSNLIWTP